MESSFEKPKLFLYSLLVPVLWYVIGILMTLSMPGLRLGITGTALLLVLTAVLISWLFAKKHKRHLVDSEVVRLVFYCSVLSLVMEFSSILGVYFNPEHYGIDISTIDSSALLVGIGFSVVFNTLVFIGAFKSAVPKFISWYLKRIEAE